jgi:CBS domain-containing protein
VLEYSTVREWMSRPALIVRPEASIAGAQEVMKIRKVRRLAVVNESGQLIGIVTLGDIREAKPSDATTLSIWEINYLQDQFTVEKIMSHEVITINENDNIITAAKLMLDHKISGLPVTDDSGELIGMITESDIFRMAIKVSTGVSTAELSICNSCARSSFLDVTIWKVWMI